VGRRLLAGGLHPAAGIAFMLAAPVVNPIVLASTWVAYSGRGKAVEMVAARAALGLLVAVAAGVLLGRRAARWQSGAADDHAHDHADPWPAGWMRWVDVLQADLLFMGRFLVLGAAVSAVVQTAVPQDVLAGLGGAPVAGALALMAAAFALSLCSEADAFVAVSFTAFPLGAQLAFLVFGPVLDAKLAILYGATFSRRFVAGLVVVAVPIALVGSLAVGAVIG
jgi:uncharacterized membrane protein YraQ (UPF0718 family)